MTKRNQNNKGDYAVGYGKPPPSTRFTKGKSGNPNGRRKGSKNIGTVLNEVLNEKVIINENGKRRQVTKLAAAIKQVVNNAAVGDKNALRLLIQFVPSLNSLMSDEVPKPLSTEEDMKMLKDLTERFTALSKGNQHEEQ